jgi:hypothetical protein
MNEGLVAASLCAAFGLALSSTAGRARAVGLIALILAAAPVALISGPAGRFVVIGGFLITALFGILAHMPVRLGPLSAGVLGVAGGGLVGGLAARDPALLGFALPWALLAFPGGKLLATGRGVVVKVLAGWLIAIAVLGSALPLVSTPGYQPDHMD